MSNFENNRIRLKFKRKRDQFTNRIESLIEIPKEIKNKFTQSFFKDDLDCSNPILIKNNNPYQLNPELILIKDEIDEILNELEYFQREKRKKKMIKMMEKIAESVDDSLIDSEELIDYFILGNKVCHIENEYLSRKNIIKNNKINNHKFLEYTNRLLQDDDECFNKKI